MEPSGGASGRSCRLESNSNAQSVMHNDRVAESSRRDSAGGRCHLNRSSGAVRLTGMRSASMNTEQPCQSQGWTVELGTIAKRCMLKPERLMNRRYAPWPGHQSAATLAVLGPFLFCFG